MIVLDTNVIAELMRPRPFPQVLAWADCLGSGMAATTLDHGGHLATGNVAACSDLGLEPINPWE